MQQETFIRNPMIFLVITYFSITEKLITVSVCWSDQNHTMLRWHRAKKLKVIYLKIENAQQKKWKTNGQRQESVFVIEL